MTTTSRPSSTSSSTSSSLRRGLGAAGAAVVVAFVGSAGLGAAQAQAVGVSTGLSHTEPSAATVRPDRPEGHPAHLPSATTTAVRYLYTDGRLTQL
ncbi:MAG: hypothetical protein ABIS35_10360 [Terracoccus sp.]